MRLFRTCSGCPCPRRPGDLPPHSLTFDLCAPRPSPSHFPTSLPMPWPSLSALRRATAEGRARIARLQEKDAKTRPFSTKSCRARAEQPPVRCRRRFRRRSSLALRRDRHVRLSQNMQRMPLPAPTQVPSPLPRRRPPCTPPCCPRSSPRPCPLHGRAPSRPWAAQLHARGTAAHSRSRSHCPFFSRVPLKNAGFVSEWPFALNFSVRVSDFLIGRLGLPTAGENEFSKTNQRSLFCRRPGCACSCGRRGRWRRAARQRQRAASAGGSGGGGGSDGRRQQLSALLRMLNCERGLACVGSAKR